MKKPFSSDDRRMRVYVESEKTVKKKQKNIKRTAKSENSAIRILFYSVSFDLRLVRQSL